MYNKKTKGVAGPKHKAACETEINGKVTDTLTFRSQEEEGREKEEKDKTYEVMASALKRWTLMESHIRRVRL